MANKEKETFFLKIEATCEANQEEVNSTVEAQLKCSGNMALSVLHAFFTRHPDLKEIFKASLAFDDFINDNEDDEDEDDDETTPTSTTPPLSL